MYILIILVSTLIGAARFAVPGHDISMAGSYEAFAHILVGMLLVWCFQKDEKIRPLAIYSLAIITIIEVLAFASFKMSS